MMVSKSQSSGNIRVQKKQLDSLLKEAAKSGISLDSMVDRILADHVHWNGWAVKAGFVQMHKMVIKRLFESVDEEAIRQLAVDFGHESKNISFIIACAFDFESRLEVFKKMITKSGFQTLTLNDQEKFLFQHNMGINCSVFYAALFTQLINELGGRSDIDYTENTLSIQVL